MTAHSSSSNGGLRCILQRGRQRGMQGGLQRGLALAEILIGLALALLALLAMTQSFSEVERGIRITAGQADAQQRGSIALWRLQRELRMAGAAFGHAPTAWGCTLNVWRSGVRILPATSAWPAPFATVPTSLLLTPIAALDDAGSAASDILLFSSGRGSASALPALASIGSASTVTIGSTAGYRAGDLLLMLPAGSVGACQIGQVDSSYALTAGVAAPFDVPTGASGTLYNSPDGFANLAQPAEYSLINLGSTPSVQMIGLNGQGQLVMQDALQILTGAAPVVLAENVRQFQLLYGLDDGVGGGVANDNVIDRWVAPNAAWAFANLHSASSNALQIKAVRFAIVVRSDTVQGRSGPSSLTLFPDQPASLRVEVSLGSADRAYQYQVYDTVVALRNQASALCSEGRRRAGIPAPSVCE